MARREKTIPDTAPAVELATYLRGLRHRAGVNYREMAVTVPCKHNTLSQSADGRLTGWAPVATYIQAINAACRKKNAEVPPGAEKHAKELWEKCQDRASRMRAEAARDEVTSPEEVGTPVTPTATLSVAAPARCVTPGSLARAETVQDVVSALNDMIVAAGIDITAARRMPRPPEHFRFLVTANARDVLTGVTLPTGQMITEFIDACRGTDDDHLEWQTRAVPILMEEAARRSTAAADSRRVAPITVPSPPAVEPAQRHTGKRRRPSRRPQLRLRTVVAGVVLAVVTTFLLMSAWISVGALIQ